MQTLLAYLTEKASQAIQNIVGSTSLEQCLPADMTQSTQKQFGHYQCNSALKLAKILKKNPRQLAEQLIQELQTVVEKDACIERAEVAGAGFINITIAPSYLAKQLTDQLKDPFLGVDRPKVKQKVIVEFSSPNIAKELHVGHLRSTIIGECLARLMEFLGHDVLRLNHVGDWGTQFGMLIAYLKQFHPKVIEGQEHPELATLMAWYKASKQLFDAEPAFKKRAQEEVVALQNLSPVSVKAWEKICEISRKAFQEIYALLDVSLQERGESYYNPSLLGIVQDLEKKHLVALDEGAKCIFLEGFEGKEGKPLPMIVQKSDGGFNYSTTDIAALKQRVEVEHADRIIYVVDAGQSLHFQMIFQACVKAGYLDPKKVQVEHVAFGLVLGGDGKKFKTRSGETEKLIDLLYTAIKLAKELLQERMPDSDPVSLEKRAVILGIDAVKYADLSCYRLKDYAFSYERMLKFEGNTAAFLLYAYVRIRSIQKKAAKDISKLIKQDAIIIAHPSEMALGMHLRRFGEIIDVLEKELTPHKLCDYLYELAECFNAFFRDCRVEGSEEEASRLLLCELTARVLEKGLFVLGLKTLDKM